MEDQCRRLFVSGKRSNAKRCLVTSETWSNGGLKQPATDEENMCDLDPSGICEYLSPD